MKYNKEYDINKTKILFLGFIIGITPFLIILGLVSIMEGGIEYLPSVFKNIIIIAGLITSIINSVILKNMYIYKLKTSSISN